MSAFDFEHIVNEATRLDIPLQHGPMMRWQRKAMEVGVRSLSVEVPDNGCSLLQLPRSARTPIALSLSPARLNMPKTPNKDSAMKGKTPNGRTPRKGKTPNKTPIHSQHDRFIPNRAGMDTEAGHYNLLSTDGSNSEITEHQDRLRQILGQPADSRILVFKQKPPLPKDHSINHLQVLYSAANSSRKYSDRARHIPQHADRVLDAPDLLDDYYLNLMSWSSSNLLAIALGTSVYAWNSANGEILHVTELSEQGDYVCSVAWSNDGNILALGNNNGCIQLWDVGRKKLLRTMSGHLGRVGSLDWMSHMLSSGARSGSIYQHDVRIAAHHCATYNHHTQEVCGLRWSPDGRHLASGGNDNVLCVWDAALADHNVGNPLLSLSQHQAAVKGLAWCPWQTSLLASGGGTADRYIRLWNVNTGACVNSIDTGSQVSSLVWSDNYRELASGHGYAQNQITIWKYPALSRVIDLTGHKGRVLALALSPDGSTIASAAADQTICLWQCFTVDKEKKAAAKARDKSPMSLLDRGIR